MLAPVAQKLLTPVAGADAALVWFGVILCVNMQTSFMHDREETQDQRHRRQRQRADHRDRAARRFRRSMPARPARRRAVPPAIDHQHSAQQRHGGVRHDSGGGIQAMDADQAENACQAKIWR